MADDGKQEEIERAEGEAILRAIAAQREEKNKAMDALLRAAVVEIEEDDDGDE